MFSTKKALITFRDGTSREVAYTYNHLTNDDSLLSFAIDGGGRLYVNMREIRTIEIGDDA